MSFYGDIITNFNSNNVITNFSFEAVYANRREMDLACAKNEDQTLLSGVVLVEYDSNVNFDYFLKGYLKNGILYSSFENNVLHNPYVLLDENQVQDHFYQINSSEIIQVYPKDNFDNDTDQVKFYVIGKDNQIIENADKWQYDNEIKEFKSIDTILNLTYAENKEVIDGFEIGYTGVSTDKNIYSNYLLNFNIDRITYNVARGYDSTVWQKFIDEDGAKKFRMIAELNSVIPTFDLTPDAPTVLPAQPHFDVNSTNVYYNLHWQPNWGFRVKAADKHLQTPALNSDGSINFNKYTTASIDNKAYPSDDFTKWNYNQYDFTTGTTKELFFSAYNSTNKITWVEHASNQNNLNIPAAIYFNKNGFSPYIISYSGDQNYDGWDNGLVTDKITLSPTGKSGYNYNTHNLNSNKDFEPDIQELSIMLPSIGNVMAQIWDIIYGGKNLSKGIVRNTNLSWYNAETSNIKKGIRLINQVRPGEFTYNTEAMSTVAGIINSAQDLMGMIITDYIPYENDKPCMDLISEDYIYFDKSNDNSTVGKYLYKNKTYKFTQQNFPDNIIPDNYSYYEQINLIPWSTSDSNPDYYYIEPISSGKDNYVMEKTFYPEKHYVSALEVESGMKEITLYPRYKNDGSFWIKNSQAYKDENGTNLFYYNYFTPSYQDYDPAQIYYSLTVERIEDDIYVPNIYYYLQYIPQDYIQYKPNAYYYESRPGSGEYIKAIGETRYDNFDEDNNAVSVYYKRDYILDTSSEPHEGYEYYKLKSSILQNSNTYYRKIRVPRAVSLDWASYQPNMYYYKVENINSIDLDSDSVEIINSNEIYKKDDKQYLDVTDFNANSKSQYYVMDLTYVLIKNAGPAIIEDSDVTKVNRLRNINEFKSSTTDLCYLYIDEAGRDRYIQLNYNNYNYAFNEVSGRYEIAKITFTPLGTLYRPYVYYYKIDNINDKKYGSYILDTKPNIIDGQKYYEFKPASTLRIKLGKDLRGVDDSIYFEKNKYYIERPIGSGLYELSTKTFRDNYVYYKDDKKLYVIEDTEKVYTPGAEWPQEVKKIPSGVKLGLRQEQWEFSELEGFGSTVTTLHGMLLKLYRHLDTSVEETRDTSKMTGILNTFQDLLDRFGALVPGQLTITDNYGRVRSSSLTTSQQLTFSDNRVASLPEQENMLITAHINDDHQNPLITVIHSDAHKRNDTFDEFDMNSLGLATADKANKIDLVAPITDNAGHVVNYNTNTITLPYGFKTIEPGSKSTSTEALSTNVIKLVADNTQDTLIIAPANKWIEVSGTNLNEDSSNNSPKNKDIFNIAHNIVSSTFGEKKDNAQTFNPAFNQTFNVPVLTVDNAGHVTKFETETVKMPGLELVNDLDVTDDIVLDLSYSYDNDNHKGVFTETRGKVDTLLIQNYDLTNKSGAKLANTDSIHQAFEKLQLQINELDLDIVGGGEGEYVSNIKQVDGQLIANKKELPTVPDNEVEGQFVSSVVETKGVINVSRADFNPTIEITQDENGTYEVVDVNSKKSPKTAIPKASLDNYGVTKLTDTYAHDTTLAVTGESIYEAINFIQGSLLDDPDKLSLYGLLNKIKEVENDMLHMSFDKVWSNRGTLYTNAQHISTICDNIPKKVNGVLVEALTIGELYSANGHTIPTGTLEFCINGVDFGIEPGNEYNKNTNIEKIFQDINAQSGITGYILTSSPMDSNKLILRSIKSSVDEQLALEFHDSVGNLLQELGILMSNVSGMSVIPFTPLRYMFEKDIVNGKYPAVEGKVRFSINNHIFTINLNEVETIEELKNKINSAHIGVTFGWDTDPAHIGQFSLIADDENSLLIVRDIKGSLIKTFFELD